MGNRTWLVIMNYKTLVVIILLAVGIFITYYFSSAGETPYNHFVLLSDAFIKGDFFVEGIYPWIEKAPLDENRFFIVNPPMPAILLIPLVKLFGISFPQHIFAHLIGVLLAIATFFMSLTIKKDVKLAVWATILVGIGSIVWFLSSVGSVWYLGQITAALFLTLVIIEVSTKRRPYLIGILLGCAYLSRIHLILTFPLFAYLLWVKDKKLNNIIICGMFFSLFVGFDFYYNFSRYGTIFNKGYFLIPGTQNEPWFSKGIMHPSYIIEDLKIAFLAMPKFVSVFPFIKPSWAGMAMWLTTPAFIFSLWAGVKNLKVKLFWVGILLVFIVVGLHGGTGFAQFGYRFAVDFYPFLTYLTILGVSKQKGPNWYHYLLLVFGIVVNLWGVLWVNIFNWVIW